MLGKQEAPAFFAAAANAPAQLMQLAESEAFCVFNHHHRSVRVVDSDFDHRGGYQQIVLSVPVILQHLFLLRAFLPAPGQADPQIFQPGFFQAAVNSFRAAKLVRGLGILNRRTHDICLPPLPGFLQKKTVHVFPFCFRNDARFHRLPAFWKLVDHGNIQVSIQNQGKAPWNRRRTHHQHMGIRFVLRSPLVLQGCPLFHAKPVLFVRDHQAQFSVDHVLADQGMGAEYSVAASLCQLLQNLPAFLCLRAPGQQPAADAEWFQRLSGIQIMLGGQDFRRRHHGALESRFLRKRDRAEGHRGLTGSHVALNQPGHGMISLQVAGNVSEYLPLSRRRFKRQRLPVSLLRDGGKMHGYGPAAHFSGKGYIQQIDQNPFKGQTSPGDIQIHHAAREMRLPKGKIQFAQMVLHPEGGRQCFRTAVFQVFQRLLDQVPETLGRKSFQRFIDRNPSAVRHNFRVLQRPPSVFDIQPSV